MDIDQVQEVIESKSADMSAVFRALKQLSILARQSETEDQARDLAIRALDAWRSDSSTLVLLGNVLRQVGLFPYLSNESLSIREKVEVYTNRPISNLDTGSNIIFHKGQSEAYRILMDGKNLVLSAPTSFGKSLLIDAAIESLKFSTVMVIVPTIALIDETRRRLAKFSQHFKIITHGSQALSDRNILVLTQERAIERTDIESIDLLIIDEFYKLDINNKGDSDRAAILNQALYKFVKISKQFYMLGPSIRGIPIGFGEKFRCSFISTRYNTVVSEFIFVSPKPNRLESFLNLVSEIDGQSLVYTRSPRQATDVMKELAENLDYLSDDILDSTASWIEEEYHRDWSVCDAVRKGIGVHHGRIPRAIAQLFVRLFNEGHLRFLICTSSLIEGVNTSAKNVILYENKIARSRIDFFTHANISGRSGRMFKHFIGRVYLLDDPPEPELDIVDIPMFTQVDDTPLGLLVQMDEQDLTPRSKGRIDHLSQQAVLPIEIIKENAHLDPDTQVRLARFLDDNVRILNPLLAWSGRPEWDQLRKTCELIFDFFCTRGQSGVFSGGQLAFRLLRLRLAGSTKEFIQDILDNDSYVVGADDAVEVALQFQRNWAMFNFPRLLMALERIQDFIFSSHDLKSGNYGYYAVEVESLFLAPEVVALEEYGIPVEIGRKLMPHISVGEGLDETLRSLTTLGQLDFIGDDYEIGIVENTIASLRS